MKKYIYVILSIFTVFIGYSGILDEDFAVLEKSACNVLSRLYDNAYSAEIIYPSLDEIIASKAITPPKMTFTFKLKTNLKNGSTKRSGDQVKFTINKSWFRKNGGIAFPGEIFIFFNGTFDDPESFCFINENELSGKCDIVEKYQLHEESTEYSTNKTVLRSRIGERELHNLKKESLFSIGLLYDIKNKSVKHFIIGDKSRAFVKAKYELLKKYNFNFEKNVGWSTPPYSLVWLHSLSLKGLTELFYRDYKTNHLINDHSYYLKEQFKIAEKYKFIQSINEEWHHRQKSVLGFIG